MKKINTLNVIKIKIMQFNLVLSAAAKHLAK